MATYVQKHSDTIDEIVSCAVICPAIELNDFTNISTYHKTDTALWDTGATNTLISSSIVSQLNLQPLSKAIISCANGEVETTTYLIHVILPTQTAELNVEAILNDNPDYQVVIGMDIISKCDLSISNKDGKSIFSLRHPSSADIVLQ